VGIFSSVTRQNYEAYLIGYLKELIHHLLEVMEDFEAVAYYRE
jgi:predicted DNA-binding protein